ncbi:MAG: A/G-specific adenine glycosylase [Eubacterium sp.]|nr:A/G-specific adenine glycosylase [Eubacterium sp.]
MERYIEDYDLTKLTTPLLKWFHAHARSLPWRDEPTPYHVWVSEIMLQQTRVEAVKGYYDRFLKCLPDVKALSECPEDELLKLWEGLGYYNRVRNLQAAARQVMEEYNGIIPSRPKELLQLKGIGSYTAGAISSIAYQYPAPAVDGNVFRVMTRVCADHSDISKPSFRKRMEEAIARVIPQEEPGAYNQALMDLGAMVCVPNGEPHCEECPWEPLCESRKNGTQMEYPNKPKKAKRKIEKRAVLIIRDGNHVLIQKRPDKGLLAGLYELPSIEGQPKRTDIIEYVQRLGLEPLHIKKVEDAKHIFSHIEWHMKGYVVSVAEPAEPPKDLLMAEFATIQREYAIPSAFSAYLKYLKTF